ncbi:MAG: T9SS type A sorting domain-containing protein, partial [Moraxellaceae bacterium]
YNGIQSNRIARLNADGTLDATFNVGTGANLGISKVVILPNGKVIIGGDFTTFNNIAINRIARLNSDGSLDTTFNTGGAGANASVQSLAVQADGKILVGGGFYNFNGVAVTTPLVRLNANGTIDSSFNMGLGTDGGTVLGLAVQPDGKIILVGGSSTFNNVVVGYIVRVNPNGSVDPTWNPGGTGANYFLYSVKLQADGKILITGDFTSYNGQACRNFVRLNSNGTLDTTFNCTTLAGGPLNVSVIQNDGKYIIGGSCTPYNGFTGKGIMRLNTDGSLDTTLIQGTGFDTFVSDLALQPDGKIIVGGGFISYNGVTRKYITRLNGSAILGVNEFNSADKVSVYPNPVTDYLKFDLHENITAKSFEVYDVAGKKVHSGDLQENQIDVSAYTSGIYFLHLKTADGMLSAK